MGLESFLIVVLVVAMFGALAQAFGANSRGWTTEGEHRPWL